MSKPVVFITGASRGIGEAIADHFHALDYAVAYGYHSTPITKNVFSVPINLNSRPAIQSAIHEVVTHFHAPISILVNNGAKAQEKPFLTITDDDWDHMLATNLRGAFACIQEVLPAMIEQQWGRIINITSIGGQWGGFNQVHYAASKAALINLTQSIAKLYSQHGITSNAISPGLVATDMTKNELATPSGIEKIKTIPAQRLGTKDEIAAIASFLASEGASYITGQTINANGGMYFG